MRVVVAFVLLLLGAAAGQAQPRNPYYGEPSDFFGTWNNVEIQRNMVIRIEIKPDYGPRVRVIVYGLHDGAPCIYGEYRGRFYLSRAPREREEDNSAVLVKVDREFVHGHVLLRFNSRGEIVSHALLQFGDRPSLYSVERFSSAYHREPAYEGAGAPPYESGAEDYAYKAPQPARPYYRGY